jgi:hypothetical protein
VNRSCFVNSGVEQATKTTDVTTANPYDTSVRVCIDIS